MKFIVNQKEFRDAIALVERATPSRPTHPILANILAIADSDELTLTGFDLSLGITTKVECAVGEIGALAFPAKLLSDIVSRLPDGDITVEVDEKTAILKCSSGKYKLSVQSAEEYPELPVIEGDAVKLPAIAFYQGLKGVLFATSADETKQILTGVRITASPDLIEFAATDGHRLAVVETPIDEQEGIDFEMSIPGNALREIQKILGEGDISLAYDESQLIVEQDCHRITSRLLEGQYPNYRQLIPRSFAREFTCDRKPFMSALERVAVMADQKNNIIKLSIAAESVVISVECPDVGSATEEINASVSGDELAIALNVKYLLEALKAMDTDSVVMRLNTATSPAVLTPLGNTKMTQLLMPVQIRE